MSVDDTSDLLQKMRAAYKSHPVGSSEYKRLYMAYYRVKNPDRWFSLDEFATSVRSLFQLIKDLDYKKDDSPEVNYVLTLIRRTIFFTGKAFSRVFPDCKPVFCDDPEPRDDEKRIRHWIRTGGV
jgi:hypothetical protein